MTNEQRKELAIRKVVSDYYDNYPNVKPYVQDNNGYFPITNGYPKNLNENVLRFYYSLGSDVDYLTEADYEEYNSHFRPKELSNLIAEVEANESWTRIEPDGSNLPEPNPNVYYRIPPWGNPTCTSMSGRGVCDLFKNNDGRCTHYMPVKEIKPPIW